MNEAENINNQQGNGVLPCVSTRVYCPECGSERFEKWVEGDPHGVTHKAKCKECDWIWIAAQFY